MAKKRFISILVLVSVVLMTLAGCNSFRSSSGELFLQGGIPAEEYRVGGGFQIRYIAPDAGIVYLVENRSRTLLGTESLLRNQAFEFFPTEEVVEGFARVKVDLSESEFVIYFVPASKLYRH